jgi:hypothetical protein
VPGDASTYSLALAKEAAAAFDPSAQIHEQSCAPYGNAVGASHGTGNDVMYAIWIYSGPRAGYVNLGGAPECPTNDATTTNTWT